MSSVTQGVWPTTTKIIWLVSNAVTSFATRRLHYRLMRLLQSCVGQKFFIG
jgi:hypothetical protein